MKYFQPNSPYLRKITLVLISILFTASFGLFYFLWLIPKQEHEMNERGLRILDQIEKNIVEKNMNYIRSFSFYRQNQLDALIKDQRHDNPKYIYPSAPLNKLINHVKNQNYTGPLDTLPVNKKLDVWNYFYLDPFTTQWNLIYEFQEIKDTADRKSVFIAYNTRNFFDPVIQYRKDFFSNYALVENGNVIYQSASFLNIKGNEAYVHAENVSSAMISGTEYVVFSKPIQIGVYSVNLLGFIKKSSYIQAKLQISNKVVFLVLSIFFLIVISMPYIKFFFMTSYDRLTYVDGASLILSLFAGTYLFIVLVLGVFDWYHQKEDITRHLQKVSTKIKSNFKQDITKALDALHPLDTTNSLKDIRRIKDSGKVKDKKDYFMKQEYNAVLYIDSTGFSQDNIYINFNKSLSTNLSEREYVQNILNRNFFSKESAPFYLESIYSYDTQDNYAAVSIPAEHLDSFKVIAIRKYFPSVLDVLMRQRDEFAIVDKSGKVLFHSRKERALRENFVKECGNSNFLAQCIAEDTAQIFDAKYYGANIIGHIQPMSDAHLTIPFYVITYYNQTLLSYDLVQTILTTILYGIAIFLTLLLIFSLYFMTVKKSTLLKRVMLDLSWLETNKYNGEKIRLISIYCSMLLLLLLIFEGIILISGLNKLKSINVEVLPVFIITGAAALLYLLFLEKNKVKEDFYFLRKKRAYRIFLAVSGAASLAVLGLSFWMHQGFDCLRVLSWLVMVAFSAVVAWSIFQAFPAKTFTSNSEYPHRFALVTLLAVALIGIFPAILIYTKASEIMEISRTANSVNELVERDFEKYRRFVQNTDISFNLNWDSVLARGNYTTYHYIPWMDKKDSTLNKDTVNVNMSFGDQRIFSPNSYFQENIKVHKKNDSLVYKKKARYKVYAENASVPKGSDAGNNRYWLAGFRPSGTPDIGFWITLLFMGAILWSVIRSIYVRLQFINYFKMHQDKNISLITISESGNTFSGFEMNEENILFISLPGSGIKNKIDEYLVHSKQCKEESFHKLYSEFPNHNIKVFTGINTRNGSPLTIAFLFYYEFKGVSLEDFRQRLDKLERLEKQSDIKLIILTHTDPFNQVKSLKKMDAVSPNGNQSLLELDLDRLTRILEKFYIYQCGLPFRDFTISSQNRFSDIYSIIAEECSHGEFLQKEYRFILNVCITRFLIKSWVRGCRTSRELAYRNSLIKEEIILAIQKISQNYYSYIWLNLSKEEKFVLYDIAQDDLTNYKNIHIIQDLIGKGIVKYSGGIKIMNHSFRNFILSSIEPEEALRMEDELKKGSIWQFVKTFIIVAALSATAFLFFTEHETYVKVVALISSLLTFSPFIIKLLSNASDSQGKR